MKPKMIWANFSVKDAKHTREFYSQLGFTAGKTGNDPRLVSCVFGDHGFVIHFFEQGSKIDDYLPAGSKSGEVIFTLSAETEAEVNAWADKVKQAGGNIFKEAGRDESNYYGFAFADPDGHRFNVSLMDKLM